MIKGHFTAVYALHRYIIYAVTVEARIYVLHVDIGVTHRNHPDPLIRMRCNGVTHRRGGHSQIMTFFNDDGSVRNRTQEAILAYIGTAVTRKKGSFISAIALYGMFIKRTGADVPAKRFFRILADNGYHSRPAIGGDYYENFSFNTGELS